MTLPTLFNPLLNPLRRFQRADPIADFDDIFRGFGMRPLPRDYQNMLDMRMDMTEDDKAYHVSIDVPGVKKEDIDVSIEGSQVAITAEVKHEQSRKNEKEVYSERYVGKAYRAFALPSEVDSSKSEAHYDGGVLTLTLPKKANGESKRLPIH